MRRAVSLTVYVEIGDPTPVMDDMHTLARSIMAQGHDVDVSVFAAPEISSPDAQVVEFESKADESSANNVETDDCVQCLSWIGAHIRAGIELPPNARDAFHSGHHSVFDDGCIGCTRYVKVNTL